ncbi:hypothetical protein [Actinoplanes derwentensis]|uniref:Uncharacterized protein n=1 Tax=Actinoplanes derwentensis TaxID=113562 RepID=A0A1H1TWA6_9ACTN|nr:hypothetical protein [Actinoplanes derwentensis]GID85149.1 hypothetical protein Ade03nite_40730 [Actinoplanes derwentensis]SDS64186.1 hypothetical protein SAMN04489716_1254 [Actinoplanes derwentensis]
MLPDVAALIDQLPASADDLSRLAGTRPDLFRPHQEQVVASALDRLEPLVFDDLCVLFSGASDRCVQILTARLPSYPASLVLAAIGTPAALTAIAADVRTGR